MLRSLATFLVIFLFSFVTAQEEPKICGVPEADLLDDTGRTATQYCQLTNADATCAPEFTQSNLPFTYSNNNNNPVTKPLAIGELSTAPMTIVIYRNTQPIAEVPDNKGVSKVPVGKLPYYVRVDKFSLLEIVGSNHTAMFDPFPNQPTYNTSEVNVIESVEIAVEYLGFTTPRLSRSVVLDETDRSPEQRWVALYYTVVVEMEKGVVTGLKWDNTCLGCSLADCNTKQNTCGTRFNQCSRAPADPEDPDAPATTTDISCAVKVYVAWSGTDKDNDYCLSGQQTISNFRRFSARFAFDQAAATANQIIDGINQDNYPEPDINV